MRSSVYRQLCVLLAVALTTFGVLVGLLWSAIEGGASREAVHKSVALLQLLLPPAEASDEEHQAALDQIVEAADLQLRVLESGGREIAVTGANHAPVPDSDLEVDAWTEVRGERQWATRLPDGRVVSVVPEGVRIIDEPLGILVTVLLLGLLVGCVTYPFVRRLTRRLELLQEEVVRIGGGDLGARVQVQGQDEITELAVRFNSSAERIEELVTSQRMLLAHVSHELRTPLARIRLGVELLSTTKSDEARVAAISADISELDDLIDELLVMSRLAADLDPRSIELIDVGALVAEEVARYPSCTLSARSPALVLGESGTLRRVVRNLIDNAFSHGQEPVSAAVTGGAEVIVRVADSGPGVPQEDQDGVWQPFRRTSQSEARPGYGLGLAFVQKAAESMGGSVEMESGERFTVAVRLPSADVGQGPAEKDEI